MLLRPLMLNPRRRSSVPTAGAYAVGTTLYDITYTPGTSLAYKARRAGFLFENTTIKLDACLSADARLALRDDAPSGQKYQLYPAGKKGLLATPAGTITIPATPTGASRVASILGSGDVIFANSSGTALYAVSQAGAVAGPMAAGAGSFSVGDAVINVSNVALPTNLFLDGSANEGGRGTYRYTLIGTTDMSLNTVAASLRSSGILALALGSLPWASAPSPATLIRGYTLTWSQGIRARGKGFGRMPAVLNLTELYDDGETGAFARYGANYPYSLPVHSLRLWRSTVVGLVVLTAQGAVFEPHAVTRVSSTFLATRDPNDGTKWSGTVRNANGTYSAGNNVPYTSPLMPNASMTPLLLTDVGMISSSYVANSGVVGNPASAPIIYSDGLLPPVNRGVAPNNATQIYAVPGIDALVSHVSVGFGQPPQAHISVDRGASWQGPVPLTNQALNTSAPSPGTPVAFGAGPYPVPLTT